MMELRLTLAVLFVTKGRVPTREDIAEVIADAYWLDNTDKAEPVEAVEGEIV